MLGVVQFALINTSLAFLNQRVSEQLFVGDLIEEEYSLKKLLHLMLQWHTSQLLGYVPSIHQEESRVLSHLMAEAFQELPGYAFG